MLKENSIYDGVFPRLPHQLNATEESFSYTSVQENFGYS